MALATVLPVAVFGAIVGYFLVEEQRETFRSGAEARALAMSTAVDAELQGALGSLDALSRAESLANRDFTYFRATAKRFLETHPLWTSVNLARPDGERVLDPLAPEGARLPPIQRFEPSFERAVQTAQPTIGDLAIGPVSKQWDFAVRVPVVRDGKVDYVLSAVIKPEAITRLLVAQGLPADWFAVVLDRNNRIVARTVEPAASVGQVVSQSLRDALARSSSGWFRGSTIEGTEVYTPFHRSEWSGWSLAMGVPADVVEGAARRGLGYLVAGLVGALALALALAGIVGRRIAAPIAELARASEALGMGKAARVPDTARVDEVRLLARSFQGSIDALRASQERMRSVVDNVVDGIISIDERGIIHTFNPAAERIFGYSAAEAIGRNVKVLMPEAYSREHDGYIANYVRTGEAKIIGVGREVEGLRKDGSIFPLDLAVSVFHIGSQRYFTGVVRDITERKRAEQALYAAGRAKDEFLATLSHELRNPLGALTAAAHVLKVTDATKEPAIKARAVIERQTRHMARLIGDLLDIGRVSAGKVGLERERLDLAVTVGRMLSTWRGSDRFGRHRLTHSLDEVWVDADPARVEQIAANLLDNALKFTPAGGSIRVSVGPEDGEAVLRVADEGVGVEPAEQGRIFELFAQGRAGAPGMGIGLALVKRLVELHDGTVALESEGEGRGATFTVRLAAVTRPEQAQRGEAAVLGARSVLLVEDNDDARQMLEAALASGGHRVRTASDGASGLALAAESAPEVALIDIGLPDMEGYEVARRMRAAPGGRGIALVAITGFGRPEDQQRAFDAGFDAHLTKPVTAERLKQTLASLA